jgi:hypothetical protein
VQKAPKMRRTAFPRLTATRRHMACVDTESSCYVSLGNIPNQKKVYVCVCESSVSRSVRIVTKIKMSHVIRSVMTVTPRPPKQRCGLGAARGVNCAPEIRGR